MSELSQKLIDILSEEVDAKKLQESMQRGMQKGVRKGKSEGRKEGAFLKARETARAMLADNMDASLVARYTSLPLEEVEALKAGE